MIQIKPESNILVFVFMGHLVRILLLCPFVSTCRLLVSWKVHNLFNHSNFHIWILIWSQNLLNHTKLHVGFVALLCFISEFGLPISSNWFGYLGLLSLAVQSWWWFRKLSFVDDGLCFNQTDSVWRHDTGLLLRYLGFCWANNLSTTIVRFGYNIFFSKT